MRKTIVYVDGFNLYYTLKKENAKWLDLNKLCEQLLTDNEIVSIKYFTARVKSRSGDLDIHVRQNAYLQAQFQNKYDVAAVITNDSDLKLPMEKVKTVLNKTVGLICPHDKPSRELLKVANFFKPIKSNLYHQCQFPEKIWHNGRTIHKSKLWV